MIGGQDYDLASPDALAVVGPDLFVASAGNLVGSGWVTEINGSTGALVKVLSAQYPYQFDGPAAMVADGDKLFVASPASSGTGSQPVTSGDCITEVNASTGALVRVISGAKRHFELPEALALSGPYLFVANSVTNSLTELDASTGALVRVISGSLYRFDRPLPMASSGGDLLVGSLDGGSLAVIRASAGARG